jgi:hypothetical protein
LSLLAEKKSGIWAFAGFFFFAQNLTTQGQAIAESAERIGFIEM